MASLFLFNQKEAQIDTGFAKEERGATTVARVTLDAMVHI